MPEGATPSATRRLLFALPLIAFALCLLALFPWLTAAQGDQSHTVGYALGTVALIAYPILLAAAGLVGVYFGRRNTKIAATWRAVWVGLFGALLVAFSAALILTRL